LTSAMRALLLISEFVKPAESGSEAATEVKTA
jgi:hypothetical protein